MSNNLHNNNNNIVEMSSSSSNTMKQLCYGMVNYQQMVKAQTIPKPSRFNSKRSCLVRVMAAGLNPVDAKGVIGDKLPFSWKRTRQFVDRTITDSKCIGFEFSGVVEEEGGPFQKGDAVFGTVPPYTGTLSEYIVAPLDQIQHKPSSLSHEQAAALPLVGLTCLQALQPYEEAKSILIIGASGGTGHVGCQMAQCLGYSTIVAICSERNTDFVKKECGATHVVCYDKEDNLVDAVINIQPTFDVILDCVTSADPRDAAWQYPTKFRSMATSRYIRLGGRSFDWIKAGMERVIPFQCFGKEKLFWIRFPKSSEELHQLGAWADDGKLKAKISDTAEFTQESVQSAFDRILDRRVKGKLVVTLSQ